MFPQSCMENDLPGGHLENGDTGHPLCLPGEKTELGFLRERSRGKGTRTGSRDPRCCFAVEMAKSVADRNFQGFCIFVRVTSFSEKDLVLL